MPNLTSESLIAQRAVHDAMKEVNLQKFEINSLIIQYLKSASSKRQEHLKRKKDFEKA